MKELAVFAVAVALIGWLLARGEATSAVTAHEKSERRPAAEVFHFGEQNVPPVKTISGTKTGDKTVDEDNSDSGAVKNDDTNNPLWLRAAGV